MRYLFWVCFFWVAACKADPISFESACRAELDSQLFSPTASKVISFDELPRSPDIVNLCFAELSEASDESLENCIKTKESEVEKLRVENPERLLSDYPQRYHAVIEVDDVNKFNVPERKFVFCEATSQAGQENHDADSLSIE